LSHDHEEVSLFEGEFFDFLLIGGGLPLEDNFLGVYGMPLLVTDLLLELADLT
jgi:hypothetical protein